MACFVNNPRSPQIVYESGEYWVTPVAKGFEIYKTGITASTRVSRVGYDGQRGLDWAKQEIVRRQAVDVKRNPLFLPKSLFDSYIVKSDGGEVTVDRIQTLSGAEKKAHELAKKYPCVGFSITSAKHGSVIKHYAASAGKAPRVDEDNERSYKQEQTREAKDAVRYTLYLDGSEYASYDTKAEAAAVGRKEGKGQSVRIKQTQVNPSRRKLTGAEKRVYEYGFVTGERDARSADVGLHVDNDTPAIRRHFDFTWDRMIPLGEAKASQEAVMWHAFERGYYDGLARRKNPSPSRTGYGDLQVSNPHDPFNIMLSHYGFHMVEADSHNGNLYELVGTGSADTPQILVKEGRSKTPAWYYTQGSYKRSGDGVRELDRFLDGRFTKRNPLEPHGAKSKTATGSASGKGASVGKTRTSTQASTKGNRTVTLTSSPGARISFGKNPYPDAWFVETGPAHADRMYFRADQIKQANEYAQKVANDTGKAVYRRDISSPYRGGSLFYPKRGKRNPDDRDDSDALSLYRDFHGEPSDGETEYIETEEVPDTFVELGDLISMKIKGTTCKSAVLNAPNPDTHDLHSIVKLVSSPDGKQLFFLGGDQQLDLHALGFTTREERHNMMIGVLEQVTYRTRKGFDKFREIDYYHNLGEETGAPPYLAYDPVNCRMHVVGGNYEIHPAGITD